MEADPPTRPSLARGTSQRLARPLGTPSPDWERGLRVVYAVVAIAVSAWLLWTFRQLVLYMLIGAIVAYVLRPVVNRLMVWGVPKVLAILGGFGALVGGLTLLFTFLLPFVGGQAIDISEQVNFEQALRDMAAAIEAPVQRVLPNFSLDGMVSELSGDRQLVPDATRVSTWAGSVFDVFADVLYAFLVIPFVAFFILKDGNEIRGYLLDLIPNRYFELSIALLEKIESNLRRYFKALLLQSLSVASVAALTLWIAGIEYALVVGLFVGIANTIPYFGPIIGVAAGSLVGVAQTGDLALLPNVLVAMAVTQLADNLLFQPFIFARAARTHPLVILLVVLIGAEVLGIVGMLIAIPVTTTLRVAYQQIRWSVRNYRIIASP
ncbi:MAG: AI-2E family transporter [Bacteroidota bacterium]